MVSTSELLSQQAGAVAQAAQQQQQLQQQKQQLSTQQSLRQAQGLAGLQQRQQTTQQIETQLGKVSAYKGQLETYGKELKQAEENIPKQEQYNRAFEAYRMVAVTGNPIWYSRYNIGNIPKDIVTKAYSDFKGAVAESSFRTGDVSKIDPLSRASFSVPINIIGGGTTSQTQTNVPLGYWNAAISNLYTKYQNQIDTKGLSQYEISGKVTSNPNYQAELAKITSTPSVQKSMETFATNFGYTNPQQYGKNFIDIKSPISNIPTTSEINFLSSPQTNFLTSNLTNQNVNASNLYGQASQDLRYYGGKGYTPEALSNQGQLYQKYTGEYKGIPQYQIRYTNTLTGEDRLASGEEGEYFRKQTQKVTAVEKPSWFTSPLMRTSVELESARGKLLTESQRGKVSLPGEAASFGIGVASSLLTIPQTVFHPFQTAKGVVSLISNPEEISKMGAEIGRTIRQEPSFALGYGAGLYAGGKGTQFLISKPVNYFKGKIAKTPEVTFASIKGTTPEGLESVKTLTGTRFGKGGTSVSVTGEILYPSKQNIFSAGAGLSKTMVGKETTFSRFLTGGTARELGDINLIGRKLPVSAIDEGVTLARGVKNIEGQSVLGKGLIKEINKIKEGGKVLSVSPDVTRTNVLGIFKQNLDGSFNFIGSSLPSMRIYKGGRITYTTKNLNIKGKIFQVIDKTGETINIKASQLTPEVKQAVVRQISAAVGEAKINAPVIKPISPFIKTVSEVSPFISTIKPVSAKTLVESKYPTYVGGTKLASTTQFGGGSRAEEETIFFPKTKEVGVSSVSLIPEQRFFPKVSTRQVEFMKQPELLRQPSPLALGFKTQQIERQGFFQPSALRSRQAEREISKSITRTIQQTTPKVIKISTPFVPKVPKEEREEPFKISKTSQFFTPQVRREKQWFDLPRQSSLGLARKAGEKYNLMTLGASFRVKGPTGKLVKLTPNRFFQPSKREPFTLVQAKRSQGFGYRGRLTTPGEKREIRASRKSKGLFFR